MLDRKKANIPAFASLHLVWPGIRFNVIEFGNKNQVLPLIDVTEYKYT
jgi:hypothetical protein